MERKGSFVVRIATLSATAIFLMYIFFKQDSTLTRLLVLPFVCIAVTDVIKSIFIMQDKMDWAVIFNKIQNGIFFLFWFGFLGVFCLKTYESSNKGMIFATIPFWIAGIYFIYKTFIRNLIKKD